MFTISRSVCIDAPASTVWRLLSELESIHVWVDSIRRSYCVGRHARGMDAVRICELGGDVTIKETMVDWVEGQSFTYVGEGAPMIKRAANSWTVEERGAQTLVTTVAEVEIKGGVFGRLLDPLAAVVAKRLGSKSLAAFKYFVENGKPYQGNAKNLLPVPSSC